MAMRKHTEDHKAKISASLTGQKRTDETRAKMRASTLGQKHTEKTKAKIREANLGKKHTEETKAKMRAAKMGERNHNWKGGVSLTNRPARLHPEAFKWARDVKRRDNYTCQGCGQQGDDLHAHHKKSWSEYPEDRHVLSNGVTLCKPCHKRAHS